MKSPPDKFFSVASELSLVGRVARAAVVTKSSPEHGKAAAARLLKAL
jgi:hypothetical protein